MKATGIIRRVDDLGRIVIPKEIRRSIGIREGDPLEIYVGKRGEVIFWKYDPDIPNRIERPLQDNIQSFCDADNLDVNKALHLLDEVRQILSN